MQHTLFFFHRARGHLTSSVNVHAYLGLQYVPALVLLPHPWLPIFPSFHSGVGLPQFDFCCSHSHPLHHSKESQQRRLLAAKHCDPGWWDRSAQTTYVPRHQVLNGAYPRECLPEDRRNRSIANCEMVHNSLRMGNETALRLDQNRAIVLFHNRGTVEDAMVSILN